MRVWNAPVAAASPTLRPCTYSPSAAATGPNARLLTPSPSSTCSPFDDWRTATAARRERRDLTEVIEDRAERRLDPHRQPVARHRPARRPSATPTKPTPSATGLLHDAHRIERSFSSMRRTHRAPKTRTPETTSASQRRPAPRQRGQTRSRTPPVPPGPAGLFAPAAWKTRTIRWRLTAPASRRVSHPDLDGTERRHAGKIVVLFEHDATGSISCAGHGLTAPTDRAECGSSTPPASVLSAGTLRVKRVSAAAGTDRNRASDRLRRTGRRCRHGEICSSATCPPALFRFEY